MKGSQKQEAAVDVLYAQLRKQAIQARIEGMRHEGISEAARRLERWATRLQRDVERSGARKAGDYGQ